jgi:hypothetical protein
MNIITRVPSAWFIHIPACDKFTSKWINLANVTNIDYYEANENNPKEVVINFTDGNMLILLSDRADFFLNELNQSLGKLNK